MRAKFVNEIKLEGSHLERMGIGWEDKIKKLELALKQRYTHEFDIYMKDESLIIVGSWDSFANNIDSEKSEISAKISIDFKSRISFVKARRSPLRPDEKTKHESFYSQPLEKLDADTIIQAVLEGIEMVKKLLEWRI
jgi:hypothetical protein